LQSKGDGLEHTENNLCFVNTALYFNMISTKPTARLSYLVNVSCMLQVEIDGKASVGVIFNLWLWENNAAPRKVQSPL